MYLLPSLYLSFSPHFFFLRPQGNYTYKNGNRFVGAFQGGRPHGQGVVTFKNGARLDLVLPFFSTVSPLMW
jgi:hypothetical protein